MTHISSLRGHFPYHGNSTGQFPLLKCSECEGYLIRDQFRGENTCENCGLIQDEKILSYATFDKNIFSHVEYLEKAQNEFFNALYSFNRNHATYIDSYNHPNSRYFWLNKLDKQKGTCNTRTLVNSVISLNRVSHNLQIPQNIIDQAMYIFKKIHRKNLLQGRSSITMMAACLYISCRKNQFPIYFSEIQKEFEIKTKLLNKFCKLLLYEFKIKITPIPLQILINRMISELQIDNDLKNEIIKKLFELPESFNIGKNPKGVCAGLIYYTSKIKGKSITQSRTAKIADVAQPTLRCNFQEINKYFEKETN